MPKLDTGKVQIYTGDGKGKTTAAIGLMFRASGYGLRTKMYQFIKKMHCSEHEAADRLGFEIIQAKAQDPREAVREILSNASRDLENDSLDLLIIDEVGEALRRGYLSRSDIETLIELKSDTCELVLTGRGLIEPLGDLADLITEMKAVKHYFDQGLLARKGIEY